MLPSAAGENGSGRGSFGVASRPSCHELLKRIMVSGENPMTNYKTGIWSMLLLLVPCLFSSGCYRGSVTRRIENDNRQDHVASTNAPQTSGIAKILATGKWYQAFLVLDACILVFLISWGALKAVFGATPTNKDETNKGLLNPTKERS
jgi:hypothetical protein